MIPSIISKKTSPVPKKTTFVPEKHQIITKKTVPADAEAPAERSTLHLIFADTYGLQMNACLFHKSMLQYLIHMSYGHKFHIFLDAIRNVAQIPFIILR